MFYASNRNRRSVLWSELSQLGGEETTRFAVRTGCGFPSETLELSCYDRIWVDVSTMKWMWSIGDLRFDRSIAFRMV